MFYIYTPTADTTSSNLSHKKAYYDSTLSDTNKASRHKPVKRQFHCKNDNK